MDSNIGAKHKLAPSHAHTYANTHGCTQELFNRHATTLLPFPYQTDKTPQLYSPICTVCHLQVQTCINLQNISKKKRVMFLLTLAECLWCHLKFVDLCVHAHRTSHFYLVSHPSRQTPADKPALVNLVT